MRAASDIRAKTSAKDVGPWVGGVEVDVRAAEVAVRAVAAAA